ncbi:MAG: prenyltransferase/squalene oxidase repeat-containing protein [Planctomycetota bacterium]|jgi:hypothetical protein
MSNDSFTNVQIETTLPKPWEEEQTFNDVLYDWMGRAPWLAISFVAHGIIYFILAAIPWDKFSKGEEVILQANMIQPQEEIFEEPEEEIEEELEEEIIEEPVIQDSEVVEDEEVVEDPNDRPESPFNSDAFNDVIGIGGGAGGGGGKVGGRRAGRQKVGAGINKALLAGLEWLKDHQSDDGSWDPENFYLECDKEPPYSTGEGHGVHEVGVTGLALLAFLGFGDTMNEGQYKDVIRRGIGWLRKQQSSETGQIGTQSSKEWIYNHAIATLALAEAQYGAPNPLLKKSTQKAVDFIARARADYGVWRYDVPSLGGADSSITGWMVFALAAAADAKVRIDESSFGDSLAFFDEVTDGYGYTGYQKLGEGSSRLQHLREVFPAEETRALTAVGVLCRVFIANSAELSLEEVSGPEPNKSDLIELGVERMMEVLPEWPKELLPEPGNLELEGEGNIDFYYWYYGSYALYQLSEEYPKAWRDWEKALEGAILPGQRDGNSPPCFEGSWDPLDPWGEEGGRVYSTALMVLCLEVYFRYGKVLGSR